MRKFNPKLSEYEIKYLLEGSSEKELKNTKVHATVKNLVALAYPTEETKFDKIWKYFYLPMKRSGKLISVPFFIMLYKKDFYVSFRFMGNLKITQGKDEIAKEYASMFKEAKRFLVFAKTINSFIIEKSVPYDFRIGKIKGKYIMKRIVSLHDKIRLLGLYETRVRADSIITQVSLNDYLSVTALCYRAVYPLAKKLSPLEMYKKWADGRHGGMIDIKDTKSEREFSKWRDSGRWMGAHPFEIIFSWHEHGIHLYPPSKENHYYALRVTNYAYVHEFILMVKAMIKNNIPFRAEELYGVLEYASGEKELNVNKDYPHGFQYIPSKKHKERYFKHIQWEKLKGPTLKSTG